MLPKHPMHSTFNIPCIPCFPMQPMCNVPCAPCGPHLGIAFCHSQRRTQPSLSAPLLLHQLRQDSCLVLLIPIVKSEKGLGLKSGPWVRKGSSLPQQKDSASLTAICFSEKMLAMQRCRVTCPAKLTVYQRPVQQGHAYASCS